MCHVQLNRTVFRSLAPGVGVKGPAAPPPKPPPPPPPARPPPARPPAGGGAPPPAGACGAGAAPAGAPACPCTIGLIATSSASTLIATHLRAPRCGGRGVSRS